jgi:predicted RNA-binding Zn-ribbon protein involved in translation (DUF1610 family)
MQPIENEKYGYLCPQCKKQIERTTVRYAEIVGGIFKTDRVIVETNFDCKHCGWSYYSTEVE